MKKDEKKDFPTVLHGQRQELAQLQRRMDGLSEDAELESALAESQHLLGGAPVEVQSVEPILVPAPRELTWEELVRQHETQLLGTGTTPEELRIEALLPPELNEQIEREWSIWPQRERWRWWEDYAVVAAAGLAGGLLDRLLTGKLHLGEEFGSSKHDEVLRDARREFRNRWGDAVPNPMSRHPIDAKVPGDLMGGARQEFHRIAGPGHDVCRYREALKLMTGDARDFAVAGQSVAEKTGGALRMMGLKGEEARLFNTFTDPAQARFALLAHWTADFFSKRGLPIPGTTHLLDLDGGAAKLASSLYESGVDFRALLGGIGKLSGVAVTELILRVHITLQRHRDGEKRIWDWSSQRRYTEMFLVGHAIASGVGGVAAVATWNPAMLNLGAILAGARYAIQLALRVRKERREAVDRFNALRRQNQDAIDELAVRQAASSVSAMVPTAPV